MWLNLPARAASQPDKRWFVQVWFDAGLAALANPDEEPGRIEVSIGCAFFGCALAPFSRPSAGEVQIVPVSLGFTAIGQRDAIKVEVLGEFGRLSKPQFKITEVAR